MSVLQDIEIMRSTRIPNLDGVRATTGYRSIPIDRDHPRHNEPCVDLREYGISGFNMYLGEDPELPNSSPYKEKLPHAIAPLYAREYVAQRLVKGNLMLGRKGLEWHVYDAWRPPELQNGLRRFVAPGRSRAAHPHWTDAQVEAEVGQYYAEARETFEDPSPHLTGCAVDLGIRHIGGELLPMGVQVEDMSVLAWADAFEMRLDEADDEARANRRLQYWLLTVLGFRVHPKEIWHASIGDQLWAQQTAHEQWQASGKRSVVPAYYSLIYPDR